MSHKRKGTLDSPLPPREQVAAESNHSASAEGLESASRDGIPLGGSDIEKPRPVQHGQVWFGVVQHGQMW